MNPHQEGARLRKAHMLAEAATRLGFTPADVPHLNDPVWEVVAEQAHCRPPGSDRTIATVASMMGRR